MQSWQLWFSHCPACCWKVCFKSTSGSHLGCNATPGLNRCHCKTCGTAWPVGKHRGENVVTPEKLLGLLPSRMLTQRDRWYTHTSLEQVCSVTQPRDNSSVSQCQSLKTPWCLCMQTSESTIVRGLSPLAMFPGSALYKKLSVFPQKLMA